MKRGWWVWPLLAGAIPLLTAMVVTVAAQSGVSETLRLRAELQQLRATLLQTEYQLATCKAQEQARVLTTDRIALEAEFRRVLSPPADAVFDWTTLTFKEKTP